MQNKFILTHGSFKKSIKKRNKSDIQNYLNRLQPLIYLNINHSIEQNQNCNKNYENQRKSFINRKISYNTERNKKKHYKNFLRTQSDIQTINIFDSTMSNFKNYHNQKDCRYHTQSSLQYPINRDKISVNKNHTCSNMKINIQRQQINVDRYSKINDSSNEVQNGKNAKNQTEIKQKIRQKINNYVQKLDNKGEQQLNNLLINGLKKQKKNHFGAQVMQHKINQMINTNRFMVKMIKQQLLNESSSFNSVNQNQNINSKVSVHYDKQSRGNSQSQNYQSIQQKSKNIYPKNNDHNNISQISRQFFYQWQKGIIHKKAIYDKFRRSLFQKFPTFSDRQIIFSKDKIKNTNIQNKIQKSLSYQQSFFSPIQDKNNTKDNKQPSNTPILFQKQVKKQNQIQLFGRRKNSFSESQRSAKKLFSLRRSLSKKSQDSFELSQADKTQIKTFNFQSLIQYVFKKAYFYSVSKNKVLQTKVDISSPIQICSPITKKKEDLPGQLKFLDFSAKKNKKTIYGQKNIIPNKLNSKGKYLIKNKQKIMNIKQQGKNGYQFLKRCLEDAIQDYVKLNSSKL